MSSSSSSIPSYIRSHHRHHQYKTTIDTDPRITIVGSYSNRAQTPPPLPPPPPPPPHPPPPTEAELRKKRKEAREADTAERREFTSDMREDTFRDIEYVKTLQEKLYPPMFFGSGRVKEDENGKCVANSEAIVKLQTGQKKLEDGQKKLEDGQKSSEIGLKKVREDLSAVDRLIQEEARNKLLKGAKKEGIAIGEAKAAAAAAAAAVAKAKADPVVVKTDPDAKFEAEREKKLDEVLKEMKDLRQPIFDGLQADEEIRSRRQDYFSRKAAMDDHSAQEFRDAQEHIRLQRERARLAEAWYTHPQPYPTHPTAQDIREQERERERERQHEKCQERERENRAVQSVLEQERREERRREDREQQRERERKDRKEERKYMERDRNMAYGMMGAGVAVAANAGSCYHHHNGFGGGPVLMSGAIGGVTGWQQQYQPQQVPVLMPVLGQGMGNVMPAGNTVGNGGVVGWGMGEPTATMHRFGKRLDGIEDILEVNTNKLGKFGDGVEHLLNVQQEKRRMRAMEGRGGMGYPPGHPGGGRWGSGSGYNPY